jgi:hypothetical protein
MRKHGLKILLRYVNDGALSKVGGTALLDIVQGLHRDVPRLNSFALQQVLDPIRSG